MRADLAGRCASSTAREPARCASASTEMLRKDTRVREFRLGAWNEGGAGVTLAEFAMIPDEYVERVRESADIVAIIGEYVKLKRVGHQLSRACPFHQGRTPTSRSRRRSGCTTASCAARRATSSPSAEAARARLRRRGEVGRREVGHRGARGRARGTEERDAREPFWEVNATAADFFRDAALGVDRRARRRATISRRATSRETTRTASGSASRRASRRDAQRTCARLASTTSGSSRPGLLSPSRKAERAAAALPRPADVPDLRRRRATSSGSAGACSARASRSTSTRPESPIFAKGTLLYGLNWAKQAIRKAGSAHHRRGLLRRDPPDARRDRGSRRADGHRAHGGAGGADSEVHEERAFCSTTAIRPA